MEGRKQFALTFHLPIYILKKSTSGPEADPRSLRDIEDVTFLRDSPGEDESGTEFDSLHQVELSCAVVGQDQHVWMAYLFADTYHEGSDNDDLEDYASEIAEISRGFEMEDPLVGKPVGKPIRKPREYFLKVFSVRSSQARHEWKRTVDHVLNYVEARVSVSTTIIRPITNTRDSGGPTTQRCRMHTTTPRRGILAARLPKGLNYGNGMPSLPG